MKTFQRVLFLMALFAGSVHILWIGHQKWVEPRGSVLDEFKGPALQEIRAASSLSELLAKYRETQAAVKAYEAEPDNPPVEHSHRDEVEPYRTEALLKEAIRDWEQKDAEIRKVRFFWGGGLLFAVAGALLIGRLPWLGLGLLMVGFSEMLYWCSPGYFSGAHSPFDRLLTYDLVLALLTMVALGVAGWRTGVLERESKP